MDVVTKRFESGTGSETDILEAQARLASTTDQKDEAAAYYLTSQIHWIHALGKMEKFIEQLKN
jgi:outer membrane protein TolC